MAQTDRTLSESPARVNRALAPGAGQFEINPALQHGLPLKKHPLRVARRWGEGRGEVLFSHGDDD
jgi:hypothetical protein